MHINKYLDEERGRNGGMENTTYFIYGPYFVKRRQISKYQFY